MTIAPIRFHSAAVKPVDVDAGRGIRGCRLRAHGLRLLLEAIDGRVEPLLSEHVLHEAERHADAGAREADVPVDPLREVAGDERPDERAEVDPHVEDREAGVAARVAWRVEGSDERADVRLEQSGAEHDQREADVEERQCLEGQREMAGGDDDAAEQRAPVCPSSRSATSRPGSRRPRRCRCRCRRSSRARVGEAEPAGRHRRDHVEDEERAHAVIAEALPHLGEEQRGEAARMAEETLISRSGRIRHRGECNLSRRDASVRGAA